MDELAWLVVECVVKCNDMPLLEFLWKDQLP